MGWLRIHQHSIGAKSYRINRISIELFIYLSDYINTLHLSALFTFQIDINTEASHDEVISFRITNNNGSNNNKTQLEHITTTEVKKRS